MAISIDWGTKVINVPQADLTALGGSFYELDLDVFRLALKALEASAEGMPELRTHAHNTIVSVGGLTLARVVEIINGYTVTFEDGQYAVNMVGANSNVGDVVNRNQVSISSENSAGLISVSSDRGTIEFAPGAGAVVGSSWRVWLGVVGPSGEPETGLASDLGAVVVSADDSASTAPVVTESSQAPGLYYLDVPGAFLTTHGVGSYGVHVTISTLAVRATGGRQLQVSVKNLDALGSDIQTVIGLVV